MVAEGGVFSPRMAFGGGREDARRSRPSRFSRELGVGVPAREGEEKMSPSISFFGVGVMVPARGLSGDRSGDLLPSR
jgi:hypothetical protein